MYVQIGPNVCEHFFFFFLSPPPSFTTEPPSASFSSEGSDWSDDTRTQQWNSATNLSISCSYGHIRIREVPSPWFEYELRVLRGWSDLIWSDQSSLKFSHHESLFPTASHSAKLQDGEEEAPLRQWVSERGRTTSLATHERAVGEKEGGGEKGGKKLREEIEAVIRKDESELMNENTQTDEGGGGEAMIQSCDSQAETPGDALWRR